MCIVPLCWAQIAHTLLVLHEVEKDFTKDVPIRWWWMTKEVVVVQWMRPIELRFTAVSYGSVG